MSRRLINASKPQQLAVQPCQRIQSDPSFDHRRSVEIEGAKKYPPPVGVTKSSGSFTGTAVSAESNSTIDRSRLSSSFCPMIGSNPDTPPGGTTGKSCRLAH